MENAESVFPFSILHSPFLGARIGVDLVVIRSPDNQETVPATGKKEAGFVVFP
jgi:hypothetical protein